MGLTTYSDPGFAVLQPFFRLGEQKKGNSFKLLGASFIQMTLAKTAKMSPLLYFLLSITICQHCLCSVVARLASSACKANFLSLCVPHAFLHVPCAFLLKVPKVVDWWQRLTDSMDVSTESVKHGWLATVIDRQHGPVYLKCQRRLTGDSDWQTA